MSKIKLLYIDLFCGAGGTSTGVNTARLNGEQCAKVVACVNHDANAIASHASNHPDALHSEEERNWMKWRIGKSAEALVKLHQRIEDGYGGVPTLEEWQALGLSNSFYNIEVNVVTGMLEIVAGTNLSLIGFHTAEQAEDFMAYPDNVQLIKDLFMI